MWPNGGFWKANFVCKWVPISLEFQQSMSPLSMLLSHSEHTNVPKDGLLWGHIKPRKTQPWESLKDFSSGWKELCTFAGNQCFLILLRPVATAAADIPAPGRASLKVPIIAAIKLLRNPGIPHAQEVPSVLPVLAPSGCLMKGRSPCPHLLLTL